jgi:hypothetical protein
VEHEAARKRARQCIRQTWNNHQRPPVDRYVGRLFVASALVQIVDVIFAVEKVIRRKVKAFG